MRRHLLGIDHLVIVVNDLAAARDAFARMGFTLTPQGRHTIGSSNHCIMLGSDYIELLHSPTEQPHPARRRYTEFAALGDGLAAVALKTDSARGAYSELLWAGFDPTDPVDFSRPVALGGRAAEARFRITQVAPEKTPGLNVFTCEHFTPDVVWRREWQSHPIGATGLGAVAMLAADPVTAAQPYARLFDVVPREVPEAVLVDTGGAPLAFMDEGALAKRLPDVRISKRPAPMGAVVFVHVADRARAERVLADGGFAPERMPDGSVAIGADRAHGVALVFG